MTPIDLTSAIDRAIGQAMTADDRIVVIGEDVPALRRTLLSRFGPDRIMEAPVSGQSSRSCSLISCRWPFINSPMRR